MALKMRNDRKSRPMRNSSQSHLEDPFQTYHTQFCLMVYYIIGTLLVKYVIIGGITWLLTIAKSVAIFLLRSIYSFSQYVFNGPVEREKRFLKGYAVVLGLMIGTLPNKLKMMLHGVKHFAPKHQHYNLLPRRMCNYTHYLLHIKMSPERLFMIKFS